MKKYIQIILFFAFLISGLNAQTSTVLITDKPTSNWPFYFRDFTEAKITLNDDKESFTNTKININLFTGELQYLDGNKVIRILDNIDDVKSIYVDDDLQFMFVDDFVVRIVVSNDKYCITQRKKGKLSDLEEGGGAYGSNVTTGSVDKINSKLIGGINNFNYPSLIETKDEGTSFDPELKYFFINGEINFILNKRNLTKAFPDSAKKISSYIKKEKISFKDEKDLIKLFEFLTPII